MRTQLKIYPLAAADDLASLPPMRYHNVSHLPIDRLPVEGLDFFYALAGQVAAEAGADRRVRDGPDARHRHRPGPDVRP